MTWREGFWDDGHTVIDEDVSLAVALAIVSDLGEGLRRVEVNIDEED